MPAPYKQAIQAALGLRWPQWLVSYAVVSDDLAAQNLDAILSRAAELQDEPLDDPWQITACHNIAAKLKAACASGVGSEYQDATGVGQAVTALTANSFIWLRYANTADDGHSVVLFSSGGNVETLEGWAGQGNRALCFHESVYENGDPFYTNTATAQGHLQDVLDANNATRLAAWQGLSRGAAPGAFGDEGHVLPLRVTICTAETPGTVTTNFRAKLLAAARWVCKVKSVGNENKSVCLSCFDVKRRGKRAKGDPGWHRCDTCPGKFCGRCCVEVRGASPAGLACLAPGCGGTLAALTTS
jgi:hypothetical protein